LYLLKYILRYFLISVQSLVDVIKLGEKEANFSEKCPDWPYQPGWFVLAVTGL